MGKSLLRLRRVVAAGRLRRVEDGRQPRPDQPAPNVVQPGAPGEPSRKVAAGTDARRRSQHSEADVAFMQGMIHHHQQAIVMTGWVPTAPRARACG